MPTRNFATLTSITCITLLNKTGISENAFYTTKALDFICGILIAFKLFL